MCVLNTTWGSLTHKPFSGAPCKDPWWVWPRLSSPLSVQEREMTAQTRSRGATVSLHPDSEESSNGVFHAKSLGVWPWCNQRLCRYWIARMAKPFLPSFLPSFIRPIVTNATEFGSADRFSNVKKTHAGHVCPRIPDHLRPQAAETQPTNKRWYFACFISWANKFGV